MLGAFGTADDEESILDALARRRLEAGLADAEGTVGDAPTPPIPDTEAEAAPVSTFRLTPLPSLSPEELEAAREDDREAHNRRVFEMAAKRAIAGFTQTAKPTAQDIVSQPGDAEAKLRADYGQRVGVAKAQRDDELTLRKLALDELRTEASGQRAAQDAEARRARETADRLERARRLELQERDVSTREGELSRKSAADALKAKFSPKSSGGSTRLRASGATTKEPGRPLPASEVSSLSELPVAEAQVDALEREFKRLNMGGMSGRASGTATDILGLRFTDAAEYNAAAKLAMQAAGKIMEGGKLAAGDEAKYAAMLPRPGDSDAVVRQKVDGLKSFLRELAGRRAKAFSEAGYAVPASLMYSDGAGAQGNRPAGVGPTPSAGGSDIPMVGPNGEDVMVEPGKVEMFRKRGFKER